MSYMTISSQENHHFSLCSYFHAHPTTLLLKILGGPMHGSSPHLKFLGGPSPSPPRSPPLNATGNFKSQLTFVIPKFIISTLFTFKYPLHLRPICYGFLGFCNWSRLWIHLGFEPEKPSKYAHGLHCRCAT